MDLVYAVLAVVGAGLFAVGFILGRRLSGDMAMLYAAGWRAAVRELQTCPEPEDDEDEDDAWKRGQAKT